MAQTSREPRWRYPLGPTSWAHDADQNGLDGPEEQAAATGLPLRSGLDSEAMLRMHWPIESRPRREVIHGAAQIVGKHGGMP